MNIKHKYGLIFIICFFLLINLSGLFDAINEKIYNNYIELNKKTSENTQIVIIQIDNKSIHAIGKWPWNRSVYITLLKKIISANPAVIGIYISFTELQTSSNDDNKLFEVLKSFNNIVLSTKLIKYQDPNIQLYIPEKSIFPGVKQGHNAFQYSDKGIVTSFPLKVSYPAFSIEIIKLYQETNKIKLNNKLKKLLSSLQEDSNSIQKESILIDYQRTPDKFKHFSFVDVLDGKINLSTFKNKIVLIGVNDRNLTSILPTPFTGKEVLSSTGVQLQAQVIDSLLNYRGLNQLSNQWIILISLIISIFFFIFIEKKPIFSQGIWLIVILLAFLMFDVTLFTTFAFWLPPASTIILIITTFTVSLYFTTTLVDKSIVDSFTKLQQSKELPLTDLSPDLNTKMNTLSKLIDVINTDRNLIKAIINGVDNGIIVINKQGIITWANTKILSIFNDSLVLNQPAEKVFSDLKFNNITISVKKDNVFIKQININNHYFNCIITQINPYEEQYVGIFNDITESVTSAEMKSTILHLLTHEIKTPVATILLSSDFLQTQEHKEITQNYLTKISNQAEYIKDLINNFLTLNELEATELEFKYKTINLSLLITSIIDKLSIIANTRNIKIILSIAQNVSPIINGNEEYLSIAFSNLIENAIKYSPVDTIIQVTISNLENKLKISIKDEGYGIPEDELNKLFNKFYRSTYEKTKNVSGTGLGLSFVHKIISLHKGTIEVKSTINIGSEFIIYFPEY
ncbi:MAG: CHASE2 domain-containing protein [Cyanobacteriota bacterium]